MRFDQLPMDVLKMRQVLQQVTIRICELKSRYPNDRELPQVGEQREPFERVFI